MSVLIVTRMLPTVTETVPEHEQLQVFSPRPELSNTPVLANPNGLNISISFQRKIVIGHHSLHGYEYADCD